jgi:hypothetical protein
MVHRRGPETDKYESISDLIQIHLPFLHLPTVSRLFTGNSSRHRTCMRTSIIQVSSLRHPSRHLAISPCSGALNITELSQL